jgi:hypothetical protein
VSGFLHLHRFPSSIGAGLALFLWLLSLDKPELAQLSSTAKAVAPHIPTMSRLSIENA